eukprot:gene25488-biopygen18008
MERCSIRDHVSHMDTTVAPSSTTLRSSTVWTLFDSSTVSILPAVDNTAASTLLDSSTVPTLPTTVDSVLDSATVSTLSTTLDNTTVSTLPPPHSTGNIRHCREFDSTHARHHLSRQLWWGLRSLQFACD